MLDRLGLSDDQKAAVEAVHEKNKDSMRPLGEAARQAHDAFQKALDGDAPDATKVGQLALTMSAAQKKLDAARKAEMDEIKAILTPDQAQKLEQAAQRGPGRGPGGPRPDGPSDRN
jgi:Spy/CpxP family protein refolding chaperone